MFRIMTLRGLGIKGGTSPFAPQGCRSQLTRLSRGALRKKGVPMAVSKASAVWNGTLKEGSGSMKGGGGAFEAPFTFGSRFEGSGKGTNPEELIGAAHAGCFSMFLAAQLTKEGKPPTSIQTSATVTLGEGPTVTKIELTTEAVVPGAD